MRRAVRRSAFVGGVVGGVLLVSSTAFAGSGVGGVFNLGKTNTVNQGSTLVGTTKGSQLGVTNHGNGPALALNVKSGTSPLTVNSGTKVGQLNADRLDGLDSSQLMRQDSALLMHGSVDLLGVVDPDESRTSLGSIAGLGTFTVGGAVLGPGEDCDITFTNTSGGPLVVNNNATPGLADGDSVELTGTSTRPDAAAADFEIMSQGAANVATGQVFISFGFPSGNLVCAGAVHALLSK
jgi:hypothetical protein